jgi:glycosyltransferase involved in cell wall biosynthesis
MVLPAARALGIPLLWHKVDFAYDDSLSGPLSNACAGVLAVSRAVGAAVRGDRLLDVLHPPVRLAEDFRVSGERPAATIGSVGRLVPYKGHHHVIEAAGRLRRSFPEVEVVIAGGPAREAPGHGEALLSSAREWGMEDRVRFLGHVERIEDVLSRLTVFVIATYRDELGFGHEGLSGAMLEASWAALPVVATRGGGTPEGVRDGVTGTLVDPEDPSGLAHAIGGYLADPALARAAGAEGAEFARAHCRPDALAARLFTDLAAVAERRPPAPWRRRRAGLRRRRAAR